MYVNNFTLDRIMQLGVKWADGGQAWVPWWTASLVPVTSVSLQAVNTTSRSRNGLIAGRRFQGHNGSAVSRSCLLQGGTSERQNDKFESPVESLYSGLEMEH